MANLVHKLNICSFWLETLCQGQKNSEANFCFPRHNVFQPKGYIFLGFHPLTFHTPLHFNGFCFILSLQILHNLLDNRGVDFGVSLILDISAIFWMLFLMWKKLGIWGKLFQILVIFGVWLAKLNLGGSFVAGVSVELWKVSLEWKTASILT